MILFFYSDTGYRTVPIDTKPESQYDTQFLDTLPHCPAFKGNHQILYLVKEIF